MKIRPERFDLLKSIAVAANEHPWAKVASAVIYKGRVISVGVNRMKSHPFQAKFGKNPHSIFLHSETHAILNALHVLSEDDLKKASLYICRVKKMERGGQDWVYGLAKPCAGCARCIMEFGIRQVVYTTGEGDNFNIL